MRIGILDSGVNVCDKKIKEKFCIYEENGNICIDENANDELGHGSKVFYIIKKYANPNSEYIIIKLKDINSTINEDVIYEAIKLLIEKNCKVINLSFYIPNSKNIIDKINRYIINKNVIIFQSNSNEDGMLVYEQTIGITVCGKILNNRNSYWYNESSKYLIVDYTPEVINHEGEYMLFGKNNSMACAKISGIISNFDENMLKFFLNSNAEKSSWSIDDLYTDNFNNTTHMKISSYIKNDYVYKHLYNLFLSYYREEDLDIEKEILYSSKFNYREVGFFNIIKSVFLYFGIIESIIKYNRADFSYIINIYEIIKKESYLNAKRKYFNCK